MYPPRSRRLKLERKLRNAVATVKSKPDTLLNVGWAAVIIVLLLFALEWFVSAPNRDSSAFIYVAKGILEGDVPYLDRWDHKGPLIFLLNAMGLALADMWSLWLLEMAFLAGTVWVAYVVLRDQFGFAATLFPMAVFAGYFLYFSQSGNHTEQYALLFQFLALYLFMRIQKRNMGGGSRGYYALFLVSIGALAAAAFLLRANLIGLWIAIGIYWVFIHRRDVVKRVLWLALGAALVILPTVWIFALVGGLSEFWDAAFLYNFLYSDAPLLRRIEAIWQVGGARLTFVLLPIVFSWCFGLYYFRSAEGRQREPFEEILKLSVIALPIEIFLVSVSTFDYGHYYMAMLPVVVILMGFFAYNIARVTSLPASLLSAVLLLCVTLYFIPIGLNRLPFIMEKYTHEDGIMHGRHLRVAEYVRRETDPGDSILVWGFAPQLYLFSGRDAPTRHFHQNALFVPSYLDSTLDEIISDVKDEEPALIIDTRMGGLPPLDSEERVGWESPHIKSVRSPDLLNPFFDLLNQEYELLDDIDGFAIYRKIE